LIIKIKIGVFDITLKIKVLSKKLFIKQ